MSLAFRGISKISIDEKGRIAIPNRYRAKIMEQNEGQMICTRDARQPCLLLYPLDQWEILEQKLMMLSSFDKDANRLQRIMLNNACEVSLDKGGRILLPRELRGDFESKLYLAGSLNKFEIWSEKAWDIQNAEDMAAVASGDFNSSGSLNGLTI